MPLMSILPNELWMSVFESLNNPSDLAKVLRTSKLFRDLAIRILHRKLIWNDPRHFAQSLRFWANHPDILSVPRTLTVGISKAQAPLEQVDRQERAIVVSMNGTLGHILPVSRVDPLAAFDPPQIKPSFVASQDLFQAMIARVLTFPQLTNLTFRNAILPANIYEILHSIPSLRVLHIEFCSFDVATLDSTWDHTTLPIKELSLLGLDESNFDGKAMFLAKAHDLRYLRFDSTACIFTLFTRLNASGLHIVPQRLESIDLYLPEKKYWPSNQQEAQQLYITPLITFLGMCSNVVHLSISNYMPEFTVPDDILPSLRSYKGPMSTVVTMTGNRPIVQLCIRDAGSKLSDFIDTLTQVGEGHSSVQELSAYVPSWDDEILYAVTQLFPNLRKLDIRYGSGSPTEDLILSIGPHFVARAPYMHTVHIFSPRDRSAAELLVPKHFNQLNEPTDFDAEEDRDPEAELKGLVNCWDRYCPQLREVQLLKGFVWRKAQVRPGKKSTGWEKRPYQLVDGERDYGC